MSPLKSVTVQCCMCNRTKIENGWLMQPTEDGHMVSHGYCPECFEKSMREIERRHIMEPSYRLLVI